jgi:hypothetical protein
MDLVWTASFGITGVEKAQEITPFHPETLSGI